MYNHFYNIIRVPIMILILINLNMPINVFGNSSNNSEKKIDTSSFVQKTYLRTNFVEAIIEEDIDLKINIESKIYNILLAYEMLVVRIMLITYSTILVYQNTMHI